MITPPIIDKDLARQRRGPISYFDKVVGELREEVKKFQASAKEKLNAAISKNCDAVILGPFPAVRLQIPARLRATLGNNPSDDSIRRRLERNSDQRTENAKAYLDRIEVGQPLGCGGRGDLGVLHKHGIQPLDGDKIASGSKIPRRRWDSCAKRMAHHR
jgi:hypothetical protein